MARRGLLIGTLVIVIAVALAACGGSGGGDGQKDAPASGDGPRSDGPRPTDGSITIDGPPVAPGPACGATTCTLGQQVCCIGAVSVCRVPGNCPSLEFACDGPEDCPNAVCCFPNNTGSRCQTNNCGAIACHVDGDCSGATPKCCPKAFTPNYKVCQAQC